MPPPRTSAALFGGTFDPFHIGHLRMAIEVKEAFSLPRIVFLPARHPPHKPGQPVSDAAQRLAMTTAAVRGIPGFEVSDLELRREGPSYSLDTVLGFRRAEPGVDWLFVMGADSFAEIATWHRYRELLMACDFILLPRPGAAAEPRRRKACVLKKKNRIAIVGTGKATSCRGDGSCSAPPSRP